MLTVPIERDHPIETTVQLSTVVMDPPSPHPSHQSQGGHHPLKLQQLVITQSLLVDTTMDKNRDTVSWSRKC